MLTSHYMLTGTAVAYILYDIASSLYSKATLRLISELVKIRRLREGKVRESSKVVTREVHPNALTVARAAVWHEPDSSSGSEITRGGHTEPRREGVTAPHAKQGGSRWAGSATKS